MAESDARPVMELFADLAGADLERESSYNTTTANLTKARAALAPRLPEACMTCAACVRLQLRAHPNAR